MQTLVSTHIVSDHFPAVPQQVHELGDSHWTHKDYFLDIFWSATQMRRLQFQSDATHLDVFI
jgi:hypothetical protein